MKNISRAKLQSLIVVAVISGSGVVVQAASIAKFDGGGEIEQAAEKTGSEVVNQIDAVPGTAGSGWLTPWTPNVNSGSVRVLKVDESEPLNGGGKYLSLDFSTGAFKFPQRHMYVIRGYSEALEPPTKFAFDLRFDDTSAFEKKSAFFIVGYNQKFAPIPHEESPSPVFPQSEGLIWALKVGGNGTWLASSGSSGEDFVDTGFPAKHGDTFHVRISLDPSGDQWIAEIENMTAKTKFKSEPLKSGSWSDAKRGFFVLGGGGVDGPSTGEALRLSFDSLSIE